MWRQAQTYLPAADVLDIDSAHHRVRKRSAITLNLSGIAKGYAVDCLAHCLDKFGITDYLVGIDGEMRARGAKPGRERWSIAIEKPLRGARCAPLHNQLAAVSVVAASCMLADAWATALLVLGEKTGTEVTEERGMDALFVLREGDEFRQIVIGARS